MTDAQRATLDWMARLRDTTPLDGVILASLRGPGLPFAVVFPDGSYCAARVGEVHDAPKAP